MTLWLGFALALTALATQLVLAELATRRPRHGIRWAGYVAIVLAAAGSAAATALEDVSRVTLQIRGLQVACFGVALAGALVVLRTVWGLLEPEGS